MSEFGVAENMAQVRLIAFYLPQYHPIPENDTWWGKGFTEWTNVVKARTLFPGHYQPHLPADLGFYDLRLPEVRQAQVDLAQAYGIHGFCYYHYWFNGRRLLERPLDEILTSGKPDFPFCLCWANENWTRSWDGLEQDILVRQKYSLEDDQQHIRWLARAFHDKRYIRINGKPLFLVYRISKLPDPLKTASIWREEAHKIGIGEIYLCSVESLENDRLNPVQIGFDAAVEFQPDWLSLPPPSFSVGENNRVYDYGALVNKTLKQNSVSYKRFPCVTPGWDNTPRRQQNAVVFKDATPDHYQQWLEGVIERYKPTTPEEGIVFINAWNEWGEGAHLEPCQKWGHAYLEATQKALQKRETPLSVSVSMESQELPICTSEITICVPTYNGARYLKEAIQSVLDQTWRDFDLVIVDDCSDDETEAVFRSFADKRLHFFRNPVRLGLVGNWNKCIELSKGKYVYIFHQDDVMLPKNLEQKIKVLDRNQDVGLVYSNVYRIRGEGDIISDRWFAETKPDKDFVIPGVDFFRKLIENDNIICCPSVIVRRECYEKLGGFNPNLPFTADWEMWLRIALFYEVAYISKPLLKYRLHEKNETFNFKELDELEQYYLGKMLVLEKYPDRIPEYQQTKSRIALEYEQQALDWASRYYQRRQYDKVRRALSFAANIRTTVGLELPGNDQYLAWLLKIIQETEAERDWPASPSVITPEALSYNYHPDVQHILNQLSGEDIAWRIPVRKLVKAIGFKVAKQPGLRWLYQFRRIGKTIVERM